MKLQQLEYVIAIAQEGSITAAAKKLYQAQPNISIALKELEAEIVTQIFWRTPNGMVLTPEGEEFLLRAKEIVESMHDLESAYSHRVDDSISLKISSSFSTYVSPALGLWINTLDASEKINIHMTEDITNKVIEEVDSGRADIGIIRVPSNQFDIYADQMKSRKMSCRSLVEFTMKILMRADHPLAKYDDVPFEELKNYVEIVHGDDKMKIFGKSNINPNFDTENITKRISVTDRGSKTGLLNTLDSAYMWVSPVPMQAYPPDQVVIKKCSYSNIVMRDLVICKKSNESNRYLKEFIDFLAGFVENNCIT